MNEILHREYTLLTAQVTAKVNNINDQKIPSA